jgi:hypothetical protein
MADLPNIEKNRTVIEGPTGIDANVTAEGNTPADILRVGGSALTLGQKTMANSVPFTMASDQPSIPVTVQPPATGTPVFKTGSLITTATTADQVVLTYTVTSGKIFYLQYVQMNGYRTSLPGNVNPIFLGSMSAETPSGTKIITVDRFHAPSNDSPVALNVPIPAGTVIRVVVTPSAATSTTWRANFGGYEVNA